MVSLFYPSRRPHGDVLVAFSWQQLAATRTRPGAEKALEMEKVISSADGLVWFPVQGL
jgi:hypothetical protein